MVTLSRKQREMLDRDLSILDTARSLLLERGFYGVRMDHIAQEASCPTGTLYQRFRSKEDVLMALACQSMGKRLDLMRRGAAFEGKTRERIVAIGDGVELFTRLYREDSRILHMAMGPVREKVTIERINEMGRLEQEQVQIVTGVLRDAITSAELELESEATVQEVAFALWGLADGCYTLIEAGIPEHSLKMGNPYYRLWRAFNLLADAYRWRPLSSEWDYDHSVQTIRRKVFSEEAQRIFGPGKWYEDESQERSTSST